MNFNKGKKNLDLFYIHNKPECISFHCFSILIKTESHFSQPYRMQMTPCRGSLRPTIALWQTYTRGCVALVCCFRLQIKRQIYEPGSPVGSLIRPKDTTEQFILILGRIATGNLHSSLYVYEIHMLQDFPVRVICTSV